MVSGANVLNEWFLAKENSGSLWSELKQGQKKITFFQGPWLQETKSK